MKVSVALAAVGILVVGLSNASNQVIYKTTAADGSVVFTDQAAPEAIVVTPSPLNIMESGNSQSLAPKDLSGTAQDAKSTAANSDSEATTISEVVITSPIHQQTLIDHNKLVLVELQTSPAQTLPEGYIAEIRINGRIIVSGWSLSLPIDLLERGAHTLQATILNPYGIEQARSQEIEIYVKKRVLAENNN